jgi:2-polyprenyl-3-methyl-5-hydroxy-6-metoxy-1,4-benzoquinol methylase
MQSGTTISGKLVDPKWWSRRLNGFTGKVAAMSDGNWWISRVDQARTNNYCIKKGYVAREKAAYFDDVETGITYQPDVYPFAAELAGQMGCSTIIDIGCGKALKLAKLHAQYPARTYVGVDFGQNIAWCKANHPFGTWIEANLEIRNSVLWPPKLMQEALILSSDVIEHLSNPLPLLQMIRGLLQQGGSVFVLSTPDRDRINGTSHCGPPPNPCHVREWNLDELMRLLQLSGLKVIYADFTRSNDAGPGLNTCLVAGILL